LAVDPGVKGWLKVHGLRERSATNALDFISSCILAGSQSTYNELGGAVTGSSLNPFDVVVGQATGCVNAGIELMAKEHPIAATILGAMIGSVVEIALVAREAR
jgi:hypothetical protein